jgi:hypothetical protein
MKNLVDVCRKMTSPHLLAICRKAAENKRHGYPTCSIAQAAAEELRRRGL